MSQVNQNTTKTWTESPKKGERRIYRQMEGWRCPMWYCSVDSRISAAVLLMRLLMAKAWKSPGIG